MIARSGTLAASPVALTSSRVPAIAGIGAWTAWAAAAAGAAAHNAKPNQMLFIRSS
jgi:hypothetical protein